MLVGTFNQEKAISKSKPSFNPRLMLYCVAWSGGGDDHNSVPGTSRDPIFCRYKQPHTRTMGALMQAAGGSHHSRCISPTQRWAATLRRSSSSCGCVVSSSHCVTAGAVLATLHSYTCPQSKHYDCHIVAAVDIYNLHCLCIDSTDSY